MALFADEHGEHIYPSVPRVAWLLGKGPRRVTADITALVALGVLEPLTSRRGGRNRTTQYRFNVADLPKRPAWKPRHERHPLERDNPDSGVSVSAAKPRRDDHETMTSTAETLTWATQNPDVHVSRSFSDRSEEQKEDRAPSALSLVHAERENTAERGMPMNDSQPDRATPEPSDEQKKQQAAADDLALRRKWIADMRSNPKIATTVSGVSPCQ
jgi:hypothetical protein